MKTVVIIQARTGSQRFPGKVFAEIAGQSMLEHVLRRVQAMATPDDILVATSAVDADDAIADFCRHRDVGCFRGPETDVLKRFHGAAASVAADVIVRVTADCPLLDPAVSDEVVRQFHLATPDYASNTLQRTFPRGLDTEVMSMKVLTTAQEEARLHFERIHVTPFLYRHPERFALLSVEGDVDLSEHRWTVDTPQDLELVQRICQELGPRTTSWLEVVELLMLYPEWQALNAAVPQKPLEDG